MKELVEIELKDQDLSTDRGVSGKSNLIESPITFDALTRRHFLAYGVGHFLNDLMASFWFNFALFYLISIVKTPAAGYAFLAGQVTDSLVTPLVGWASDNLKSRFGQRTVWYALGFGITVITFPLIFLNVSATFSDNQQIVYYAGLASAFNVGWAFVQISHLSMAPALSCSKYRRDRLNNLRNTFGFVANFVLLSFLSVVIWVFDDYGNYFFGVALLIVFLGSATSLMFLLVINEQYLTGKCTEMRNEILATLPQELQTINRMEGDDFKWYYWFKKPRFYLFGFAYLLARLTVNMTATLFPFFIKQSGNLKSTTFVLLLLYLSSITSSAKLDVLRTRIGSSKTLLAGVTASLLASLLLFIYTSTVTLVFAAILIGASQAIIMNSVVNWICLLIGARSEKGASVFGLYSFADKLVTGVVIYTLTLPEFIDNQDFIRAIMVAVPPLLGFASCFLAWVGFTRYSNKAQQILSKDKMYSEFAL